MRSLFTRLFGSSRAGRTPLCCYLRENGPIAYELALFDAAPREAAERLLSAELAWAWKSGTREWTHLTRISLSAFLADSTAGVLLVGVDGELPTHLTDATIRDWLRRFCRVQPGPVAAAISVTPARQLVFVQQHASDAVNRMLETLGLDKSAAVRKAYPRLGTDTLESIGDRL